MKLLPPILTILTAFLTPIAGLGCMMIGAVLLDTIFAIYVTIRRNGIKSFRSGKLFNIVPKLFFYLGCILLSHAFSLYIIEIPMFGINDLISKLVTTLFIYIEVKSIDETYIKLTGVSLGKIIASLFNDIKNIKKDINDTVN